MEKLHRHSDGSAITLTGDMGIQMLRQSGNDPATKIKFFEYKPSVTSEFPVRIEWDGDMAVIPSDAAWPLIQRAYARHASEIQLAAWNDAVDRAEVQVGNPTPEPVKETVVTAPTPETAAQPAATSVVPPSAPAPVAPAATKSANEIAAEEAIAKAKASTTAGASKEETNAAALAAAEAEAAKLAKKPVATGE